MKARLIESREIAPDVRHFVFDMPELETVDFLPGQFLSLSARIQDLEVTRAYSIASPPDANRFALCLNRVEDGLLSPYLFDMRQGSLIDVKGPYGVFTFRQPPNDSVMVATGTGIAPFRGMLKARLSEDPDHRYTLIFGVRHEYGLLYRDEFEELARQYPNFEFWPTLTRAEPSWAGRTGRVQPYVLQAVGERRDLEVYICGLRAMVDDTRKMLKEIGFDRKRIVFERYD